MSVTLYFAPATRATRPRWLLEELGVPYEVKVVDLFHGEQHRDAFVALHPLGKVPVAVIDDVVVYESTAIIALLADRHADKGLAPPVTSAERGPYLQWLFFATATLEPALLGALESRAGEADEDQAKRQHHFDTVATVISKAVAGQDWLLGSGFSAADVVVGAIVAWAASMKKTTDPALLAYARRCKDRPAFKAGLGIKRPQPSPG